MAPPRISPQVLKFIAEKIGTVAELEALLIMCEDESRLWNEQELAARLYTQAAHASKVLTTLARRELLAVEGKPPRYSFRPAHEHDRQVFAEVAEAYRQNLVAIATYIHSRASAPVQEFARAFELKKDH